jgi:hypothetical protein
LRNDADVLVGCGDVEVVVGVDGGVRDAGREVPWAEGALADGSYPRLLASLRTMQ